jgi:hypothetical protein|tara:strand:+ start:1122 stop:1607 length:486 start_codon:yes stop_codon:yes gene_type:complete
MDTLPLKHTKWSDRLAFDIALLLEKSGETLDEVIERHAITADDMLKFNEDPIFRKKTEDYRNEIREKGVTFRLKARAQAEELLVTSWQLIHSPEVSPAVKADLIKSTVKWGNLEPKNEGMDTDSDGRLTITINLGETTHKMTQVIEHELEEGDNAKLVDAS